MKELLSTEKSYVEDLRTVISGYHDKEPAQFISNLFFLKAEFCRLAREGKFTLLF